MPHERLILLADSWRQFAMRARMVQVVNFFDFASTWLPAIFKLH